MECIKRSQLVSVPIVLVRVALTVCCSFFNSAPAAANPARTKVSQIFDGYREDPKELENEINFDGVTRLLGDLSIGLEDIEALYVFEFVQSPQLGRITRDGFVDAFGNAGADSTAKMRNTILARKSQLPRDRTIFKSVYNHTIELMLEDRKRAIDLDQAIGFWQVLFSKDGFEWSSATTPWLDWYTEFLQSKWNKAINKDLWRQTLTFAEASSKDESLSFWSEESSWPSVIDDFVQYVKEEKRPAGGDAMEIE